MTGVLVDERRDSDTPAKRARRRGSRGRSSFVGAVVLIVAGTLFAGSRGIGPTAAPVRLEGGFTVVSTSHFNVPVSNPATITKHETLFHDSEFLVEYRDNAQWVETFGLHNKGARPVRIDAIIPSENNFLLDVVGVHVADASYREERRLPDGRMRQGPTAMLPFRPFTLAPDDHRFVEFTYRFHPRCVVGTNGSQQGGAARNFDVRYRDGWANGTVTLLLPHNWAVPGPIDC